MKNTMNGFRSEILRNGQDRRVRCIYGISWYRKNWFRNPIKNEQWMATSYSSAYSSTKSSSSSSSSAAVTRWLHKNYSNDGSGGKATKGRRRRITGFIGSSRYNKTNTKEEVPNELLAVEDTTIVFIINSNGGSGDTDRGRRRRRIIQCICIWGRKKKDNPMNYLLIVDTTNRIHPHR